MLTLNDCGIVSL